MIIKQIIVEHWERILMILGPVATWFFTKRPFQEKDLKKEEIAIETSSSEVVSKNLMIYQAMLDDIEKRYQQQLRDRDIEISSLRKTNGIMKIEISDLNSKVDELSKTVAELNELIHKYEL